MGFGDTLYNVRDGQGVHSRSKYCGLAACCARARSDRSVGVYGGARMR